MSGLLALASLVALEIPLSRSAYAEVVSKTSGGPSAMLALHLDPDSSNGAIENATPEHWERLVNFVAAADADVYGHKLTLLMSSSWVDLVDGSPDGVNRSEQLKSWIENGHQLGYHHHSCGHKHPDGYRDVTGKTCKGEDNRGSVQVSFAEVFELGESIIDLGADPDLARVEIAAQGPNDNNEYRSEEWQAEAIYATGPVHENSDGHTDHKFITLPRCTKNYGNNYGTSTVTYEVAELGHAQLDVGDFVVKQRNNNLAQLEVEIDQVLTGDHVDAGVHLGIVFHPREYYENSRATDRDSYTSDKAYLDAVLKLFSDKGLPVVTAREILQASSPCTNSGLPGDFNRDGVINAVDIDLLRFAINTGSADPIYDVNGGGLDGTDFDYEVQSIIGSAFGDADLNQQINFTDFVSLSTNFGSSGTGWGQGNFNLDNNTNFADFVFLANNYGAALSSGVSAQENVPEPASLILLSLAFGVAAQRRHETSC